MRRQRFALQIGFDEKCRKKFSKFSKILKHRKQIDAVDVPRITLLVTDDGDRLVHEINRCLPLLAPFTVCFNAMKKLNVGNNVVALIPQPTEQLTSFHANVCNVLTRGYPHRGIRIKDSYQIVNWHPHCILAKGVPPLEFEYPGKYLVPLLKFPISGQVEKLFVVDLSGEVEDLLSLSF